MGSDPTLRGRVYYYLYIETFYVDIIADSHVVINKTIQRGLNTNTVKIQNISKYHKDPICCSFIATAFILAPFHSDDY